MQPGGAARAHGGRHYRDACLGATLTTTGSRGRSNKSRGRFRSVSSRRRPRVGSHQHVPCEAEHRWKTTPWISGRWRPPVTPVITEENNARVGQRSRYSVDNSSLLSNCQLNMTVEKRREVGMRYLTFQSPATEYDSTGEEVAACMHRTSGTFLSAYVDMHGAMDRGVANLLNPSASLVPLL